MSGPDTNRLLAALDDRGFSRFCGLLRHEELAFRRPLIERGDAVSRVYFPRTAIIAQQVVSEVGRPLASVTIGSDGVIGHNASVSGEPSLFRCVVLVPGRVASMDASIFVQEVNNNEHLRGVFGRYQDALTFELCQLSICMRSHTNEQRLARFMLRCCDNRNSGVELSVDEAELSLALGVRRSALVLAARTLQGAGYITYAPGVFRIVDRGRLDDFGCECIRAIANGYHKHYQY